LQARVAELEKQLDPESIQHWDTMRIGRDEARKDLRDLQHAVWHALDDSEDRGESDWVCVDRKDIDALSKLVPEDHPAVLEGAQPRTKEGDTPQIKFECSVCGSSITAQQFEDNGMCVNCEMDEDAQAMEDRDRE
jgi:hypothetical protein